MKLLFFPLIHHILYNSFSFFLCVFFMDTDHPYDNMGRKCSTSTLSRTFKHLIYIFQIKYLSPIFNYGAFKPPHSKSCLEASNWSFSRKFITWSYRYQVFAKTTILKLIGLEIKKAYFVAFTTHRKWLWIKNWLTDTIWLLINS